MSSSIGELFFVGIPGPTLDDATRQKLETLQPSGVILFRRNVGTPAEVAALTTTVRQLPSHPLIAIDHEGGRVQRLGEPFTQFPAAAAIGSSAKPELAYRVGRAMAAELANVGIDINFAPVLDVNSNPSNPVIGDRAFGADPTLVSEMGTAMLRGLRDGGVIPCGKHFPGHGDTETDSHLELPIVRRSREQLERTELAPFRAAIAAGVPLLMTAHVLYTALDLTNPATLSRAILTDLLRTELSFDGVVASDDLEMRAIADHQSIGAAAIATLQAGADMLLVCQDVDKAIAAAAAIEDAARAGTLDPAVITAAAERVQRMRGFQRGVRVACELPNPAHRALVEAVASRAQPPSGM